MIARFVALITLFVISPFIVLVAILIRIKMGSPVLFCQDRVGLKGKVFKLYKFRTMTPENEDNGSTKVGTNRITPLGVWLRETSIDELPQLLNIIMGDMNFVGPRPLLVEYLPIYTEKQAKRHDVKPGLTGWASVNGRNKSIWEKKFELDVWYVENRTLWLDFKILIKTAVIVFKRESVNQSDTTTMEKFTGSKSQ